MSHCQPGFGDALHTELWKLCAGPLVYFPTLGERVLYFPQGHMEHLAASVNDDVNQQFPRWNNLPSKILCRVANIQLLAERETNEAYARITLDPIADQTEPTSPDPNPDSCVLEHTSSFIKLLTRSDVSSHGGFTVHRKHATACFPPLEAHTSQNLVAKDLHGSDWNFTHVFRGTPLRHSLTHGWNIFVSSKGLVVGDAIVFLRGGNRELRIGVRRLGRRPTYVPSLGISSRNMYFGELAAASLALQTPELLIVYYKPRSSEFIVGLNKYLKAINNKFSFGMHFKMRLEGENLDSQEESGVIVGVGDLSPQWPKSKWRSLKVQWDEHATLPRPERISPWEIEPLEDSVDVNMCTICSKEPKAYNTMMCEQRETAQKFESLDFRLFGFVVPNSITADPLKQL